MIPHKIQKAISLLEYSGFLFSKSAVKTAKRRQAPRFSLHLGVAASEKVFHSKYSRDPDFAISKLSLADYREFYSSDSRFDKMVEDHPSLDICPNGHNRKAEGNFCSECGAKFKINLVVENLLTDPVDNLPISDFLISKLRKTFRAKTIREALALTESRLQMAKGIGPIRARQIVNSTEEYVTG